jgi:hypothetical protein
VIAAGTGQAGDQVAFAGQDGRVGGGRRKQCHLVASLSSEAGKWRGKPMGSARVYVVPSTHLQHDDQLEGLENKCQLLG